MMQGRTQAKEVGLGCGLTAILLRWCVSLCDKGLRIWVTLVLVEKPSDAKINQKEPSIVSQHHIGGFEIAKNDWRKTMMKIGQDVAQLQTILKDIFH